jgi:hypothetical protein
VGTDNIPLKQICTVSHVLINFESPTRFEHRQQFQGFLRGLEKLAPSSSPQIEPSRKAATLKPSKALELNHRLI